MVKDKTKDEGMEPFEKDFEKYLVEWEKKNENANQNKAYIDFIDSRIEQLKEDKGRAGELAAVFQRHYHAGYSNKYKERMELKKLLLEGSDTVQEMLDNGLSKMLKFLLPRGNYENYEKILLRLQNTPYAINSYRRSCRAESLIPYFDKIYGIIDNVYQDLRCFNLAKYLLMSREEIRETEYKVPSNIFYTEQIALALDEGEEKVLEAVKDILIYENHGANLTRWLIVGIGKSNNKEMHRLVCDLLLAAKLQEGLRQVVFETADEGTVDYFITIIKTIIDNKLTRFSSCIRAVDVWMGLGYEAEDKRVIDKIIQRAYDYLTDEDTRRKALDSMDAVEIYIAMWAESVFKLEAVIVFTEKYIHGCKHQKLLALSFLRQSYTNTDTYVLPYLEDDDIDVMNYAISNINLNIGWSNDKESFYSGARQHTILKEKSVRDLIFNRLSRIMREIPKDGYITRNIPFEWSFCAMGQEGLFGKLLSVALYDDDKEKLQFLLENTAYGSSDTKIKILKYVVNPNISKEREFLFGCLSDKSMPVRQKAVDILAEIPLMEDEVLRIENLLSLKTGGIRLGSLKILKQRETDKLLESVDRLLSDKVENKRLGALDILMELWKNEKVTREKITESLSLMPKVTEREKILVHNLTAEKQTVYDSSNGFGLYDPEYRPKYPAPVSDGRYTVAQFRKVGSKEIIELLESLEDLIEQHKDTSYKVMHYDGSETEVILGNRSSLDIPAENKKEDQAPIFRDYILSDIWEKWADQYKLNLLTVHKYLFVSSQMRWNSGYEMGYSDWAKKVIGTFFGYSELEQISSWLMKKKKYTGLRKDIIQKLAWQFDAKERFSFAYDILVDFIENVEKEDFKRPVYDKDKDAKEKTYNTLSDTGEVNYFIKLLNKNAEDEIFEKILWLFYELGELEGYQYIRMDELDIARAFTMGLVDINDLYRTFMCQAPSQKMRKYTGTYNKQDKKNVEDYPILEKITAETSKRVIEIEIKRGDTQTPVSAMANGIRRHEGAKNFAEILAALGNETLQRGYIYGSSHTKREVFSSLLKACVPAKDDNEKTLKKCLNGRVSDKRLLEAAMYAPAWINIVEKYLKWKGLKSAAWYFHAHTSEGFSAEFETEVARFSPITSQEFQDGAFDIKWFKSAYKTLGAERFNMLYDCAKYLSDGSSHRRAQLFADAVLGRLDIKTIEAEISDKRNKDKLMSYSLIPLKRSGMKDALKRYEFIQKFLKESKTFGAQRRESEGKACKIALDNLARNLGIDDALRFSWKMEILKIEQIQNYFKPHQIGEASVFIETNEMGAAEVVCMKKGKRLKSMAADLKKNPYILELREIKASLKAQYTRAKASLEKAMENQDFFPFEEIRDLIKHPVIKPLVTKLVFDADGRQGFFCEEGLIDGDGEIAVLKGTEKMTIAHPYNLYQSGKWSMFQKYAFDQQMIQPFKQIFRELYLINEDEKSEKTISRRYAGHQVQPKRTVALLKSRGWTVDYDMGLQKVYYNENIIATLYALADWFSPADIEPPTLETICFYSRKDYKKLELQSINPIIFSEIMRDIDLVVSVAHAGGVDPIASHSTIEMREVVIKEALRLMKVDNVSLEGSHGKIKGKYGEYSVHLGSGICHKSGMGALNILPVHSQHRGRIFLPFLDEDPKTAEIISKIILLAEDHKLRDPSILSQIQG